MIILLLGHSFLWCSKWRVFWQWFARTSSRRWELIIRYCNSSLTFDSRTLKEHLKPMFRTKFCYYTNAKSHYPRVKSDLRYSELPKMSPPSSARLTKSQVQQMRDWRLKHGQSVAQKPVRNMSTKDNPGTLPMNLHLTEQPKGQPFDLGKVGKVPGETTQTLVIARRERGRKEGSSDLIQSSGDFVYLASDALSCKCRNCMYCSKM